MTKRIRNCGCYRDDHGFVPCKAHDANLKELEQVTYDLGMKLKLLTFTMLVEGRP